MCFVARGFAAGEVLLGRRIRWRRSGRVRGRGRSARTANSASVGGRETHSSKAQRRRSGSSPGCLQHAFGECARGLDELHVVEEHERLQRRGGRGAGDGADLAVRGVEGDHVGRRHGALPIGVERAAVEFFAVVLHEGLGGCGRAAVVADLAPQVAGRVGVDAGAAEAIDQQAADFEGCVADEFGGQAEARAAGEEAVLGIAGEEVQRAADVPGGAVGLSMIGGRWRR